MPPPSAADEPVEEIERRIPPADFSHFHQDPYRPARMRGQLWYALVGLIALTVAFAGTEMFRGYWDQGREFAEIMVPAELAVLGSAVTFYFTRRDD